MIGILSLDNYSTTFIDTVSTASSSSLSSPFSLMTSCQTQPITEMKIKSTNITV